MKLFSVAIFMALSVISFGQKQKKDLAGVITFIVPPSDMALQEYSSFILRTNDPTPKHAAAVAPSIEKGAVLPGFTKVNETEAFDFVISISFADNKFDSPKHTTGKSGETTVYNASIVYSALVSTKVMLKDGTELFETSEVIKNNYAVSNQKSKADASTATNNAKPANEANYFTYATSIAMSAVADKYCYVEESMVTKCFTIKAKKFNYDKFNAAFENIKKAVEMQSKENLLTDEMKTILGEVKTDLIATKGEVDLENKKAAWNDKNVEAIYYNLAITHFLLQEYDEALAQFQLCEKINKLTTLVLPSYIAFAEKLAARQ